MNTTAWLVTWKLLGEPQTLSGTMFATVPARAFPLLSKKPGRAAVNGNAAFLWRLPKTNIEGGACTIGISIRRSQPEDVYTCWCWGDTPLYRKNQTGPQIREGDDLAQICYEGLCELHHHTADCTLLNREVIPALIIARKRLGAGERSGTEGKGQS